MRDLGFTPCYTEERALYDQVGRILPTRWELSISRLGIPSPGASSYAFMQHPPVPVTTNF